MRKGNMTIFASILVIALVAAGVGMGTMAWFSDTETSEGNVFTAGTLDLKIDKNPAGDVFEWVDDPYLPVIQDFYDVGKMKPGDYMIVIVGIKNFGNVDGRATLQLQMPIQTDGGTDGALLGVNIDVVVSYGDKSDIGDEWNAWTFVDSGTLYALSGELDAPVALEGGEDDYWVLEFSIPSGVGNQIQGDGLELNVIFGLDQLEANPITPP